MNSSEKLMQALHLSKEDFEPKNITEEAICELAEMLAEQEEAICQLTERIGGIGNG